MTSIFTVNFHQIDFHTRAPQTRRFWIPVAASRRDASGEKRSPRFADSRQGRHVLRTTQRASQNLGAAGQDPGTWVQVLRIFALLPISSFLWLEGERKIGGEEDELEVPPQRPRPRANSESAGPATELSMKRLDLSQNSGVTASSHRDPACRPHRTCRGRRRPPSLTTLSG